MQSSYCSFYFLISDKIKFIYLNDAQNYLILFTVLASNKEKKLFMLYYKWTHNDLSGYNEMFGNDQNGTVIILYS